MLDGDCSPQSSSGENAVSHWKLQERQRLFPRQAQRSWQDPCPLITGRCFRLSFACKYCERSRKTGEFCALSAIKTSSLKPSQQPKLCKGPCSRRAPARSPAPAAGGDRGGLARPPCCSREGNDWDLRAGPSRSHFTSSCPAARIVRRLLGLCTLKLY